MLELHWNGKLLVSEDQVLALAANMTYAGKHPNVHYVKEVYNTGVRRTAKEMRLLEKRLTREPEVPKWAVVITPAEPHETILPKENAT